MKQKEYTKVARKNAKSIITNEKQEIASVVHELDSDVRLASVRSSPRCWPRL